MRHAYADADGAAICCFHDDASMITPLSFSRRHDAAITPPFFSRRRAMLLLPYAAIDYATLMMFY